MNYMFFIAEKYPPLLFILATTYSAKGTVSLGRELIHFW